MAFITVAGVQDIGIDHGYASSENPVVGIAETGLKQGCNYIVTNNEQILERIMKDTQREGKIIVTPRRLYARYIWKKGIECLPEFPDLLEYNFDPMIVSQQQLALAFACWLGSPSIFLTGYTLDSEKETPALKAFFRIYPQTKFAYIRKPNPQKINIFNEYSNIIVEDTNIFKEMLQHAIQT